MFDHKGKTATHRAPEGGRSGVDTRGSSVCSQGRAPSTASAAGPENTSGRPFLSSAAAAGGEEEVSGARPRTCSRTGGLRPASRLPASHQVSQSCGPLLRRMVAEPTGEDVFRRNSLRGGMSWTILLWGALLKKNTNLCVRSQRGSVGTAARCLTRRSSPPLRPLPLPTCFQGLPWGRRRPICRNSLRGTRGFRCSSCFRRWRRGSAWARL